MTVLIDSRQNSVDAEDYCRLIEKVIHTVVSECGVIVPVEVSVSLVDNDEIKQLNTQYRGIQKETDVLSFPLFQFASTQVEDINNELKNSDPGYGEQYEQPVGDIVISMEKAIEQAAGYGHSVKREVAFLTAHGMLHLLGYNHEIEEDKLFMRRKEKEIMDILSIKRG